MNKKKDLKERKRKQRIVKSWQGIAKGVPAFIIGCGCSLNDYTDEQLKIIEQYFCICVNQAFQKIKPDILLWQDFDFFKNNSDYIIKNPDNAIMMCRDITSMLDLPHLYTYKLIPGKFQIKRLPYLQGSGNSGALAFELAYNLGCNPIVLLGMDCCYNNNGDTDFFGKNKYHTNQTLINCRMGLAFIKMYASNTKIYSLSLNTIFKRKNFNKVIKKIGIGKKIKLI